MCNKLQAFNNFSFFAEVFCAIADWSEKNVT